MQRPVLRRAVGVIGPGGKAREDMSAKIVGVLLLAASFAAGCQKQSKGTVAASGGQGPATVATMSEEQKAIYALGAAMGQQVGRQVTRLRLTPAEQEFLKKGFLDTVNGGKPEFAIEQYAPKFEALAQARAAVGAAEEKQKTAAFREAAAKEQGAVKTASGLVYRTLKPGSGPQPKATDVVRVNYVGSFPDGKVFDSSIARGQPVEFSLSRVIPCWSEGVQRMKVGEKAKLVCPSEIAYGDGGQGEIPPGATLVFEVDLLGIKGK